MLNSAPFLFFLPHDAVRFIVAQLTLINYSHLHML